MVINRKVGLGCHRESTVGEVGSVTGGACEGERLAEGSTGLVVRMRVF